MSASRARTVLIAAFAISLLLHLLLAGYIRWPSFNRQRQEPEIVTIRHLTIARVARTPAPTPQPTQPPTPAPKPKVNLPVLTAHGSPAPHSVPRTALRTVPRVSAAPSAPPTPSTVAKTQPCIGQNLPPSVTQTPGPPTIPPDARASKFSGTVAIAVQLDAHGNITKTTVAKSSGSSALDEVAAGLARDTTYTPALASCKPVASVYTFTVTFQAW